jgi:hypothetical protein
MEQIDTEVEQRSTGGGKRPIERAAARWFLWLSLTVALFFWKVLFTAQFSILHDWEGSNQGYAWHQFAVSTFQKGIWPVWDPYAESGRSHVGEMQSGLFYPLKAVLYWWPLPKDGMLSPRLWHEYYVLAHLLGAFFMFLLARELGVTNGFAAFVAGICFGLGGFLGSVGGHQLWDSAVWLPLILFFLLRSLRSVGWPRRILYSCCSGLSLAMVILAGSLHISMMDSMVVVSAAVFFALQKSEIPPFPELASKRLLWSAVIIGITGLAAFAAGAVQLFPSIEQAPLVMRWGAEGETLKAIPYASLTQHSFLTPRALLAFVFGGDAYGGEISPYFGVLPLLMSVIGAWQYRGNPWTRYAAALAVAAFLYALAPFSLLHGLLYLVPYLFLVREAGRFVYLIHFGMAMLVGFGAQALFDSVRDSGKFLPRLVRAVGMTVGIFFLVLLVPAMYGKQYVSDWVFFSFILWLGGWCVLLYISSGHRSWKARFLLVAWILFDLYGFNWTAQPIKERENKNEYYFGQVMAARPMADFLKRRPGLFRVHVDAEQPAFVNLGDTFGVQCTLGQGAVTVFDYMPFTWFPRGLDLLNVRYIAVAGKQRDGQPIFTDGPWRVYENPTGCPRSWIVHEVILEPSVEKIKERIQEPGFNLLNTAFVNKPIPPGLLGEGQSKASINFTLYEANRMELAVRSESPGLLVLSEIYYPGWEALVNGLPKHIYKVDGILRGLLLDRGDSHVVVRYRPRSILLGAASSAFTFTGIAVFALILFWRSRASLPGQSPDHEIGKQACQSKE